METAQDRRSSSSNNNNNNNNKDNKDNKDTKDNTDKDQVSWRSLQKSILKQTFLKDWCEIVVISVSNHPKTDWFPRMASRVGKEPVSNRVVILINDGK